MHLNILHLDDAIETQPRFAAHCARLRANHIDAKALGSHVRLWARKSSFERLADLLSNELQGVSSREPVVTWIGSGDFHHVSGLLVDALHNARGEKITIIQFDHHPDWVKSTRPHCGSWVSDILRRGAAQRVISIGVGSDDLSCPHLKRADLDLVARRQLFVFPISPGRVQRAFMWPKWRDTRLPTLQSWPGFAAVTLVLKLIVTDTIYVTIDKDVLSHADARTNWDQGRFKLSELIAWLRAIVPHKRLVGLDVVGDWTTQRFAGNPLDIILKHAEAFIDQPSSAASRSSRAHAINDRTNVRILEAVEGMVC